MTLILTVANIWGIVQSSDYQLTDEHGSVVSDQLGSKQLQATFVELDLNLAFTGVAVVGVGATRQTTVAWLSDELNAMPREVSLQQVCESLAARSAQVLTPLGERGVLTIVIGAARAGKPFRSR